MKVTGGQILFSCYDFSISFDRHAGSKDIPLQPWTFQSYKKKSVDKMSVGKMDI